MRDTPKSRRKVVVRARPIDRSVQVSVADSGCGIEPAALPSLFDAFFTTRQSGLGMGLPIARGIVERHGGKVWAQNNPDGGATFFFTVPVLAKEPVLVGSET
jgi:two-component system sensor kinase FixL